MSCAIHQTIWICGLKVYFPYQPYPCQISYMEKIIKALQNGKNALLESPTGTGKTLSLLCATLAWQNSQKQRLQQANDLQTHKPNKNSCKEWQSPSIKSPSTLLQNLTTRQDSDDDFKTPSKLIESTDKSQIDLPAHLISEQNKRSASKKLKSLRKLDLVYEPVGPSDIDYETNNEVSCEMVEEKCTQKYPKIFYTTRTHKQLSQVVKEFRKTYYKDVKMTILASREQTCINPSVASRRDRNELCTELLKKREDSCKYYHNLFKLKHQTQLLQFATETQAWDIEDITNFGKRKKMCPYFSVRSLVDQADIIFCPYNYLMDKAIRNSLGCLNIPGQVILFDEAHNIETLSCESASLSIERNQLWDCYQALNYLSTSKDKSSESKLLAEMCLNIYNHMERMSDKLTAENYETEYHACSGKEMLATFNIMNMGPDKYPLLQSSYNKLNSETDVKSVVTYDSVQNLIKEMPNSFLRLVESILITLGYLYHDNSKFLPDYRLVLSKVMKYGKKSERNGKKGFTQSPGSETKWEYNFNLWCMNPAVALFELDNKSHSIVLTSGTLAPVSSFCSETGMTFDYVYEAGHVIPGSRVWVRSLGRDLDHVPLRVTFGNRETLGFQDGLGEVLVRLATCPLGVVGSSPGGILVFLPSYPLMDKLVERWKLTGVWQRLSQGKDLYVEPRDVSSAMDPDSDLGPSPSVQARLESLMADFAASCGVLCEPSKRKGEETLLESADEDYNSIRRFAFKRNKYRKHSASSDKLPRPDRGDGGAPKGGLLFAIYRGKISEGVDFSDDLARLVVTVGLPYPNLRAKRVALKRAYNDEKHRSSLLHGTTTVLTGSEWYEIQAFRALNQALGRCLRHKNDWGAILLLDQRFDIPTTAGKRGGDQSNPLTKIPKWIRDNIKVPSLDAELTIRELITFQTTMYQLTSPTLPADKSSSCEMDCEPSTAVLEDENSSSSCVCIEDDKETSPLINNPTNFLESPRENYDSIQAPHPVTLSPQHAIHSFSSENSLCLEEYRSLSPINADVQCSYCNSTLLRSTDSIEIVDLGELCQLIPFVIQEELNHKFGSNGSYYLLNSQNLNEQGPFAIYQYSDHTGFQTNSYYDPISNTTVLYLVCRACLDYNDGIMGKWMEWNIIGVQIISHNSKSESKVILFPQCIAQPLFESLSQNQN